MFCLFGDNLAWPRTGRNIMAMDWSAYIEETFANIGVLANETPSTLAGYRKLHAAGAETGRLDEKTRELICIAVAITTRCDGCIGNHVEKAIKAGATRAEIADACGVAVAMNAGAALAYAGRAMQAHGSLTK
jgi:AhpD family alkylhydroperoxidase